MKWGAMKAIAPFSWKNKKEGQKICNQTAPCASTLQKAR